ncbi:MAG: co-chaperone GroES [Firmicutes bacterium]|nr:co-chaperone GroES [Bacillota bacterium]
MKLKPLFDKIIIKQIEANEVSSGGILLPSKAQEKSQMATVISVGPGGMIDGKEIKMEVKAGDKIIYGKYAGSEVKINGEELVIIRQNDILAIVTD